MKCAIGLILDDLGQDKVSSLKDKMKSAGLLDEDELLCHVTIADVELEAGSYEALRNCISEFSKTHKKVKLDLCSAGTFATEENVLFLAPITSQELLSINRELVKILSGLGFECNKYYCPEHWQAHVTLFARLSNAELLKGLDIILDDKCLPLEVVCDRIDIFRHDEKPYSRLDVFNLS